MRLFIFLFLVGIVGLTTFWFKNNIKSQKIMGATELETSWDFDEFKVKAYETNPTAWVSDLYFGHEQQPRISFKGYFYGRNFYDITGNGTEYLEILLLQGQLVNSQLFKYLDGKLERVPVSTEKPPTFFGIVASGIPEYQDLDGDGTKEMLVPHRHYPPEAKRTVEVYKYTGQIFQKEREYEENTNGIYY